MIKFDLQKEYDKARLMKKRAKGCHDLIKKLDWSLLEDWEIDADRGCRCIDVAINAPDIDLDTFLEITAFFLRNGYRASDPSIAEESMTVYLTSTTELDKEILNVPNIWICMTGKISCDYLLNEEVKKRTISEKKTDLVLSKYCQAKISDIFEGED